MQTAEKNAKAVQGTGAKGKEVKTENRPSLTGKEAKKDEATENQKPTQTPQVEAVQTAEAKAGSTVTVDNQPADTQKQAGQQEVKAEEPKAEAKPELTLEAKLKAVDNLHRASLQRNNLISRMKEIEAFEVNLKTENDELNDNPFQGCKLIIEDDKKRQFVTMTPGLIRLVAQFIYDACEEKKKAIEAQIVFPTA